MRISIALAASFLALVGLGCGGGTHDGGSAAGGTGAGHAASTSGVGGGGSGGSVSSFPEATHPPLPQVKNFGGPVLASPKIVSITFPNDPLAAQIDDFVAKLGATSYFTGNAKEYGVGPAGMGGAIHLAESPFASTVDDTQIKAWLAQEAGKSLPASDGSTLYALFFLDTQTVTHQGGSSCMQFAGYHEEAPLSVGGPAPYAIVARCASAIKGVTGLAQVTGTASHEIMEASTDPFPDTKPAYLEVEIPDFAWEIGLGGGEVADLCAQNADAYFQPAGFAYTVQRTWSNQAALAGKDPCVPAPAGAYFNSAAVMPDMLPLSLLVNGVPQQVSIEGVQIAVGSSKSVELDLFSDAPEGPWTVSASDFTVPPQMPIMTFSFDATSGQNGDKLHVTITPLQASFTNMESFVIKSQSGSTTNSWIGLVGN